MENWKVAKTRKINLSAAAIVVVVMLAGCGGGDGGTPNFGGAPSGDDGGSGGLPPGDDSGVGDQPPGDGGGVVGFVPGPVGGQAEAATARPIAGSVTQSSDTEQGVTANAVTASVSLDAKGLLNADVSGAGWRFRNEEPVLRAFEGGWGIVYFAKELGDGSRLGVFTFTDRNRPAEQALRNGDAWVPSGSQTWNQLLENFEVGVSGTLNGIQGTLLCSDCDVRYPADFDFDSQLAASITFNSEAFASDRYDQALHVGPQGGVGDPRRGFWFVREPYVSNTHEDADYLALGGWTRIPKEWFGLGLGDPGFNANYYKEIEYGVFVDGNDPFRQDRVEALTGTATYAGEAYVYYVDTNITGTHPVTGVGIGKDVGLAADATLTAQFGSASENGMIGGRIHNFRNLEDEDLRESNPHYFLGTVPTELTLGSTSIGNSHSGFFEGTTSMTFDGSSFAGKWGGQFYGNDKSHGMPGSSAGTFGAATADGTKTIMGLFGAYKR